jgi:uncharacterized membrane protein
MSLSIPSGSLALLIAAAVAAAILSGWMLVGSYGMNGLPGCGTGSGCGAVTKSRWSRLGPIHVAGPGCAMYAVILIAGILLLHQFATKVTGILNGAIVTCSLLGLGSVVWFVLLQAFVIRRFCMYCMLTHVCGLVIASSVLSHVESWSEPDVRLALAIALVGMIVLIAGQIVLEPKTYAVIGEPPPEALVPEPTIPVSANKIPVITCEGWRPSNRKVTLFAGRARLNLDDRPLMGKHDAEHVIGLLLDFACEECHQLHRMLYRALDHYGSKLAVVPILVPLSKSCNPAINCPKQERPQACQYARLSLAVWNANPSRYEEWDRFMVANKEVQPFGMALAKAKELADISSFRLHEADPILDKQIETNIKIYEAAGKPLMPCIFLSKGALIGRIPSEDALFELLEKHLFSPAQSVAARVIAVQKAREPGYA